METKKFKTTIPAWELIQDHLKKVAESGRPLADVVRIADSLDHSRRTFEVTSEDLALFGIILIDLEDQLLQVIQRNWTARHDARRIKQLQVLLDLVALTNKVSTAFPEDKWK